MRRVSAVAAGGSTRRTPHWHRSSPTPRRGERRTHTARRRSSRAQPTRVHHCAALRRTRRLPETGTTDLEPIALAPFRCRCAQDRRGWLAKAERRGMAAYPCIRSRPRGRLEAAPRAVPGSHRSGTPVTGHGTLEWSRILGRTRDNPLGGLLASSSRGPSFRPLPTCDKKRPEIPQIVWSGSVRSASTASRLSRLSKP